MINQAIHYLLKNSTALAAIVGTKVYPVVMPEKTKAPCVVYFRDSLQVTYDKHSPVTEETEVSVICFSKSYPEAVEIIAAVRASIEWQKGTIAGVKLILARVRSGEEGYDVNSDTYFQKLTFICKSSNL